MKKKMLVLMAAVMLVPCMMMFVACSGSNGCTNCGGEIVCTHEQGDIICNHAISEEMSLEEILVGAWKVEFGVGDKWQSEAATGSSVFSDRTWIFTPGHSYAIINTETNILVKSGSWSQLDTDYIRFEFYYNLVVSLNCFFTFSYDYNTLILYMPDNDGFINSIVLTRI